MQTLRKELNALRRQVREELRETRVIWDMFHQDPIPSWIKHPVFVDGRTDLYGDELLREYLATIFANSGWRETLRTSSSLVSDQNPR